MLRTLLARLWQLMKSQGASRGELVPAHETWSQASVRDPAQIVRLRFPTVSPGLMPLQGPVMVTTLSGLRGPRGGRGAKASRPPSSQLGRQRASCQQPWTGTGPLAEASDTSWCPSGTQLSQVTGLVVVGLARASPSAWDLQFSLLAGSSCGEAKPQEDGGYMAHVGLRQEEFTLQGHFYSREPL